MDSCSACQFLCERILFMCEKKTGLPLLISFMMMTAIILFAFKIIFLILLDSWTDPEWKLPAFNILLAEFETKLLNSGYNENGFLLPHFAMDSECWNLTKTSEDVSSLREGCGWFVCLFSPLFSCQRPRVTNCLVHQNFCPRGSIQILSVPGLWTLYACFNIQKLSRWNDANWPVISCKLPNMIWTFSNSGSLPLSLLVTAQATVCKQVSWMCLCSASHWDEGVLYF